MLLALKRLLYRLSFVFTKRQSRTIHYAFPVLLTSITLLGASLLMPTDASYIRIEVDKNTISPGENFALDVYVGAHIPVNAINIEVTYPKDTSEVVGIDTGESVITIWTKEPYIDNNKVIFSGGTYRKGFLGEHLIGTINLKAKEEGRYSFEAKDIQLFAGDGSGSEVIVTDSGQASLALTVGTHGGAVNANVEVVTFVDINGDGKVSMLDIMAFMAAWSGQSKKYDFNGDNRMTFKDFGIILAKSVTD